MSEIAPQGADSQAQFLLGFDGQAQFNISGKLEPLSARVSEVSLKEKEEEKECLNQLDLLIKANQINIPLPNTVHGEEECKRGYIAHICKHHGTETKDAEIVPVYCGKLNCVDSTVSLSKRRARNAIHGTRTVNGEKIGLDKLLSNFSLGYFVYTLPEHLRRLLYDLSFLNKWHKACLAFTKEILIANGAREDALFAYKTYFHGNGDIDPSQYKPHLNILVPLVYWSESKGKTYKISSYFPSDFFDSDKWRNRYRELAEKELGFDLFDIAGKKESQINFYYQPRITLEEKLHCVKYNSRVLPNFSRINNAKIFYPRSSGLLSQKRSKLLALILSKLDSVITVNCHKHKRGEVNCAFTAISAASEAALDLALLQYFKHRQTIGHGDRKIAKSTADPPSPKALLRCSDLLRQRQ